MVSEYEQDHFRIEPRGDIEIKGEGPMPACLVDDNDSITNHNPQKKNEVPTISPLVYIARMTELRVSRRSRVIAMQRLKRGQKEGSHPDSH